MNLAVFAYSRQGCRTARRIAGYFAGESVRLFAPERLRESDFAPLEKPSGSFYGALFREMDTLIFVGSCGIAVREIAPHLKNKAQDPAVLTVDELGTFVIALLSGHIGGANALARGLAAGLEATPVITTATDINRRFSVDAWAARQAYIIGSLPLAKAVSAAILEGTVPICSDYPLPRELPPGLVSGASGELGIYVGYHRQTPFEQTLQIIPPVLHLGIGCRRGTAEEAVTAAVTQVLSQNSLDPRAVKTIASIDLKQNEPGLLAFARKTGRPLAFYTAGTLSQVTGDFTSSAFVASVTGVDNVCERAAMVGADSLLVKKAACHGVTVAVAAEHWEVSFG